MTNKAGGVFESYFEIEEGGKKKIIAKAESRDETKSRQFAATKAFEIITAEERKTQKSG